MAKKDHRVNITYDTEDGNKQVKRELPFVMGVIGDYSGDNAEKRKETKVKERAFVKLDRYNFDKVLADVNPTLNLKVPNTVENDDSEFSVNLSFNSMDDFHPDNLIDQVEPIRKLVETRDRLRDLLSEADVSDKLESVLEDVLKNTTALSKFTSEMGVKGKGE